MSASEKIVTLIRQTRMLLAQAGIPAVVWDRSGTHAYVVELGYEILPGTNSIQVDCHLAAFGVRERDARLVQVGSLLQAHFGQRAQLTTLSDRYHKIVISLD